jgi:hypothetical protein
MGVDEEDEPLTEKKPYRPIPIVGAPTADPVCDWCRADGETPLAVTTVGTPWGADFALCHAHLDRFVADLMGVQAQIGRMVEAKRAEVATRERADA